MDHDPDIPILSVETSHGSQGHLDSVNPPKSETAFDVNVDRWNVSASRSGKGANNTRLDSSPSRSPLRTARTRQSTPSSPSLSRSTSVASLRDERSATPRLDKKRSTPNFSVRSSTPGGFPPQYRRASSNLNPLTPVRARNMDRPQMTPASVAQEYLRRELAAHDHAESEVLVLTHDACYGHRFSRPRTRKSDLESIVERPERIHATILGASTAYVRLGGRHKDSNHAPHPDREPEQIPFKLAKSTRSVPLSHPAVIAVHGTKWMESLQLMCDTAEAKLAMGQKELARPIGHTKDSKGTTLPALHPGDLYLASESLYALQGCLGGVCDAVDAVYNTGSYTRRAFVCIRPPGHHCSAEMPSGFCWLNNVHIGISYAALTHGLTHAAIIDFDLHHGDGSQTITWSHNQDVHTSQHFKPPSAYRRTPIGYYSLHDINSYPCEYGDEDKVRNASTCIHSAHGQSIWNVHLEPWKNHEEFFQLYKAKYVVILEKARSFLLSHAQTLRQSGVEPRAAIFLSSGFDASEWESSGMQRHSVNVPTDFYARFTEDVVNLSEEPNLGVDGRIISVLEGGYSDRALTSGVMSHLCGLAAPSQRKLDVLSSIIPQKSVDQHTTWSTKPYESLWWHIDQLESLEAIVEGREPLLENPKEKLPNSYSSPTHASTAKMTEIAKERSSISSQLEARLALENAPPEPVPEVDWATASFELSRLLIPADRQTASCTHEELNAENTRLRRDRQSLSSLPVATPVEDKMQLRDRKSRQPTAVTARPRASSKTTNRRTTIAAASELPDPALSELPRTRRRSSAASSVLSSLVDLKLDQTENMTIPSTRPISRATPAASLPREMPVKKTRAPARKPASATSSPRKARTPAMSSVRTSATPEKVPFSSATDTASSSRVDTMDELTSGMKKISIKLKMPTEDEHNANQKRATDSGNLIKKAARKPPVPKFSKPKATSSSRPNIKTTSPNAQRSMQQLTTASNQVSLSAADTHMRNPQHEDDGHTTTITQDLVQTSLSSPHSMQTIARDVGAPGKSSSHVTQSASEVSEAVLYPTIKLEYESPPPANGVNSWDTIIER